MLTKDDLLNCSAALERVDLHVNGRRKSLYWKSSEGE